MTVFYDDVTFINLKKIDNISMERISTGIFGLDDLIEGGFPKPSNILVAGSCGTGKTTFSLQFLVEGVRKGETCLFISLEETISDIIRFCERYGWELKKMFEEEKIKMLKLNPARIIKSSAVDEISEVVAQTIKESDITRIAFDSLTTFCLLFESELAKRIAIARLCELFKKLDCVSIMTGIMQKDTLNPPFAEFVADGVILLYYAIKGDERTRAIEIRKMRGTDHSKWIHPLEITQEGLRVISTQHVPYQSLEPLL